MRYVPSWPVMPAAGQRQHATPRRCAGRDARVRRGQLARAMAACRRRWGRTCDKGHTAVVRDVHVRRGAAMPQGGEKRLRRGNRATCRPVRERICVCETPPLVANTPTHAALTAPAAAAPACSSTGQHAGRFCCQGRAAGCRRCIQQRSAAAAAAVHVWCVQALQGGGVSLCCAGQAQHPHPIACVRPSCQTWTGRSSTRWARTRTSYTSGRSATRSRCLAGP